MAGRRASAKRLSLAGKIANRAKNGATPEELAELRRQLDEIRLTEILEWASVAASRPPSRAEMFNTHREARRMFAPPGGEAA